MLWRTCSPRSREPFIKWCREYIDRKIPNAYNYVLYTIIAYYRWNYGDGEVGRIGPKNGENGRAATFVGGARGQIQGDHWAREDGVWPGEIWQNRRIH